MLFDRLWQDIRYASRSLARNPGFGAVAVLSLALGIGANTAIFSVVNGLLLRPPAVRDPATLLELWQHRAGRGSGIGSFMQLSYPDYGYYRDHNRVFSQLAAFTGESFGMTWNRQGEGQTLQGALASANFFPALGVRPFLGRTFLPEEDNPSHAAPVVFVSHSLWSQQLGSDPGIAGKQLVLNGRSFTVIGVGPASFTGLFAGSTPDVWLPLSMVRATNPSLNPEERRMHWLLGVGRLRPGFSAGDAKANLAVLGQQLSQAYPDPDKDLQPAALPAEYVPSPFRTLAGGLGAGLMAVAGIVLLIACANAANLLLAKASSRRREMAIRAAIGADRRRLMQQTLTESILLALVAGGFGLSAAQWITPILLSFKPSSVPVTLDPSLDLRVLAFTLVISVATGLIFGLAPALDSSCLQQADLKEGSSQGGSGKSKLRSGLVIAQVSSCTVLLVGAGLCVRSLLNARSIDPGFNTQNGLAASLSLEKFGYSEKSGRAFYRNLLNTMRGIPGVASASLADHMPLSAITRMESVESEGTPETDDRGRPGIAVDDAIVEPSYFETMDIPLVRGRGFAETDGKNAPAVVIVNQTMAQRFWKGQDPIGKYLTLWAPNQIRIRAQIVGIVRTGKYQSLGEDEKPFFYRCFLQSYEPSAQVLVRTRGNAAQVTEQLRKTLQQVDPRMALVGLETFQQHMQLPLFPAQAAGLLLGGFGFLALLLAIGGIYGVMAFSVSQRTREMGIRMALGADGRTLLLMVIKQGVVLTSAGLGLGVVAAFGVTRLLSSLLYGISPTDAISFGAVAIVLIVTATLASYLPARRATRVNPMLSLRSE